MMNLGKKAIAGQSVMLIGAAMAVSGLLSNNGYDISLFADPELEYSRTLTAGWTYFQRVFNYDKITASVLTVCILYIYHRIFTNDRLNRRDYMLAGILTLVFSAAQTVGNSFAVSNGWNELTASWILLFRGLLYCWGWIVISFPIFTGAFIAVDRIRSLPRVKGEEAVRSSVLKNTAVTVLCYIPYLILFYPGTDNGDTIYQITEYFGFFSHKGIHSMSVWGMDADFIHNHHPYLTTVIFGNFARLGRLMTGGNGIAPGIAVFSLFQIICISLLVSLWMEFMRKEGTAPEIIRAGYLFCRLFPGFGFIAVCMIKDSLFCISIIAGSLQLAKIVRSNGLILENKAFLLRVFVVSMLISLTKSQGVYMVAVVFLCMIIVYHRKWMPVISVYLIPVLFVQLVWLRILLPSWNIAPAGHQEMIGPLMQQTARYVVEHAEEVTEEEKEYINGVMEYDRISERYDPVLTDPVKKLYRSEADRSALNRYYLVWFRMLFKHPKSYIDATLNTANPFFHVSSCKEVFKFVWENDEFSEKKENGLYAENAFPGAVMILSVVFTAIQKVPVVGLLFTTGFYTWTAILLAAVFIRDRNFRALIPMSYMLLSVMVYFIIPSSGSGRYGWPVLMLSPIITVSLFMPVCNGIPAASEE